MFPFNGWHAWHGPDRLAGLVAARTRGRLAHGGVPQGRLLHRLRHGQPLLRLRACPSAPVRGSVHRFVRTGGQIGGNKPVSSVPRKVLNHWLHPSIDTRASASASASTSPTAASGRAPTTPTPRASSRNAIDELDARGRAPRAVLHGRGHLRAARAVDAAEALPRPATATRLARPRAVDAALHAHGQLAEPAASRAAILRRMRDLYAAEVTMTDDWIGHFLDRLHDLKLERDTVIALVGDHGILLGEHGWTGKISTALYPALTRVPLIVVHPHRRRAGQESPWFASTHDVAPTLLSMAGVRRPHRMTGADLSRPFRGPQAPASATTPTAATPTPSTSARTAGRCGATNRPGRFRLFDLQRDPGEFHNVADRHPGRRRPPLRPRRGPRRRQAPVLRRVTCGSDAREVAGDLRGEARPAPGAARAGNPHEPAGGGEAARPRAS